MNVQTTERHTGDEPEAASPEAFAERLGLRRSEGRLCLARLIGLHCRRWSRNQHPLCAAGHQMEGVGPLDHGTLWTRAGRAVVVVGQPYQLLASHLRALANLEDHGLSVVVGSEAWHNEGCVRVEIWAPERRGEAP